MELLTHNTSCCIKTCTIRFKTITGPFITSSNEGSTCKATKMDSLFSSSSLQCKLGWLHCLWLHSGMFHSCITTFKQNTVNILFTYKFHKCLVFFQNYILTRRMTCWLREVISYFFTNSTDYYYLQFLTELDVKTKFQPDITLYLHKHKI